MYPHSLIRVYPHSLIRDPHSLIRVYPHSLIRVYLHSLIRVYLHSLIRVYLHSLIRVYPHSLIRVYLHSLIRVYPHSLISVLVVCIKKLADAKCAQWRFRSDCTKTKATVNVLKLCTPKCLTKWPMQTVQTQIRLLLKEQSDQGLQLFAITQIMVKKNA